MMQQRIAALFDAENVACQFAGEVLAQLREIGVVQSACAVGDFSILAGWMDCAREHGIDLVMQPGLGKGKNSADIRLAIEAMDLAHRGRIDAVSLVTRDRDFTPLAFRLRESGLAVMGYSPSAPSPAFRAACSNFHVLGNTPASKPNSVPLLTPFDIQLLDEITAEACGAGDVDHHALNRAVRARAPVLAAKLSGRFIKTLVSEGLVEKIGSGPQQRLRRTA